MTENLNKMFKIKLKFLSPESKYHNTYVRVKNTNVIYLLKWDILDKRYATTSTDSIVVWKISYDEIVAALKAERISIVPVNALL